MFPVRVEELYERDDDIPYTVNERHIHKHVDSELDAARR